MGPAKPDFEIAGDVAQLVEFLPNIHKALGSVLSLASNLVW